MGKIILFSAITVFISLRAYGQIGDSSGNGNINRHRTNFGVVIGWPVVGIGAALTTGGIIGKAVSRLDNSSGFQETKGYKNSKEVETIGIVALVAGVFTIVTGTILHERESGNAQMSLIAPKKNELGLAYNFR